ncbi:MAG TPA: cache domain-containing protein [Clostridia bacterium]|nr:cache domain-containing protein [Clostridia bacterium]
MTRVPLFRKIGFVLAMVVTLSILIIGVASIIYMSDSSKNVADEIIETQSKNAIAAMDTMLNRYEHESKMAAESLATNTEIVNAFERMDPTTLCEIGNLVTGKTGRGANFVTFTDNSGKVIARTHSARTGDYITHQKNITQALYGNAATFVEFGNEVRLGVRSGAPVKNEQGKIIGIVSTGYSLLDPAFVEGMKEITGDEFTVFIGDNRVNTTVR